MEHGDRAFLIQLAISVPTFIVNVYFIAAMIFVKDCRHNSNLLVGFLALSDALSVGLMVPFNSFKESDQIKVSTLEYFGINVDMDIFGRYLEGPALIMSTVAGFSYAFGIMLTEYSTGIVFLMLAFERFLLFCKPEWKHKLLTRPKYVLATVFAVAWSLFPAVASTVLFLLCPLNLILRSVDRAQKEVVIRLREKRAVGFQELGTFDSIQIAAFSYYRVYDVLNLQPRSGYIPPGYYENSLDQSLTYFRIKWSLDCVVYFVLPLLVSVYLYIRITLKVRRRDVDRNSKQASSIARVQRNKVLVNCFICSMFIWALTWTPRYAGHLARYFLVDKWWSDSIWSPEWGEPWDSLYTYSYELMQLFSLANPLIFILIQRNFQKLIRNWLRLVMSRSRHE